MNMYIERHLESEISSDTHRAIQALRNSCFIEHAVPRSYGKQLPHFRILASDDQELVGHVGVDHRVMRFGDQVCSVFGVVDLCVAEDMRGKGIGGALLSRIEEYARRGRIDVMFLLCYKPELYLSQGFRRLDAECNYLGIDEHKNLGVLSEHLSGEIMIKSFGMDQLPTGPIDFLGYMF